MVLFFETSPSSEQRRDDPFAVRGTAAAVSAVRAGGDQAAVGITPSQLLTMRSERISQTTGVPAATIQPSPGP